MVKAKATAAKSKGEPERDALVVDPEIPGQKWVVLSFVSPEDMVAKRNLFDINQWLYHEVNKTLKAQAVHAAQKVNALFSTALQESLRRLENSKNEVEKLTYYHLKEIQSKIQIDEEGFAKDCLHQYHIDQEDIEDRFKIYRVEHQAELENQFNSLNNFATSVRGVKIRGIYNTREEADKRAQFVRDNVERGIHAYVGQVGWWLAWDPDPDGIKDSNYMNDELNRLMIKYHENVADKNQFFEERKAEMMTNANQNRREILKERLRQKLRQRKEGTAPAP